MLRALALRGEDLPATSSWVMPRSRAFTSASAWHGPPRPDDYPLLAAARCRASCRARPPGGWAKFCCVTQGRSVIVKFSSSGDNGRSAHARPAAQAPGLQVLAKQTCPPRPRRCSSMPGRVFLESERLTAAHLATLASARRRTSAWCRCWCTTRSTWAGNGPWAATAQRMRARGLLTPDAARCACWTPGALIGNTDRHYGNISLVLVEDDWPLAHRHAAHALHAIAGELVPQTLAPDRMVPTAATLDVWRRRGRWRRTFGAK